MEQLITAFAGFMLGGWALQDQGGHRGDPWTFHSPARFFVCMFLMMLVGAACSTIEESKARK